MSQSPHVVLDTNVIYAGLFSRRGASYRVLSLFSSDTFETHLSVPLLLEYEAVLRKNRSELELTESEITTFLDAVCATAGLHEIHFLWRPRLRDPDDDMVLEVAMEAGCEYIVTHNKRDFEGVEEFGIGLVTARELLELIGDVS